MKREDVFHRAYRMDAMAEERWDGVCQRILAPGQGPAPPDPEPPGEGERDRDSLRLEYLQAVLAPGGWYSVVLRVARVDSKGQSIEVKERKHFQLMSLASGESRPSVMRTVLSHDNLMMTAKLALRIQELEETEDSKSGSIGGSGASAIVYRDSEPRWVHWKHLGPWNDVFRTLSIYVSAESLKERPGCIKLSNRQTVTSPYALTDPRCPTLKLLFELHIRKWKFVYETVLHDSATVGNMDGRESCRMKKYYMVLLQIDRCIGLTSQIPSDEYVIFYELLLAGIKVEPGLSLKQ